MNTLSNDSLAVSLLKYSLIPEFPFYVVIMSCICMIYKTIFRFKMHSAERLQCKIKTPGNQFNPKFKYALGEPCTEYCRKWLEKNIKEKMESI